MKSININTKTEYFESSDFSLHLYINPFDMKNQIEKLMEIEELTSVKLAELLSVQPSNISHILSGRNNPSYDFISKLLERFPSYNAEWLLRGKGAIYKSKSTDQQSTLFTDVKEINGSATSVTKINTLTEGYKSNPDSVIFESNESIEITLDKFDSYNNESDKQVISDRQSQSVEISENTEDLLSKVANKKKVVQVILLYDDKSFLVYDSIE